MTSRSSSPVARNTDFEYDFSPDSTATVAITRDGAILLNDTIINNIQHLPDSINEMVNDGIIYSKKIILKADEKTEYGKIVDVLKQIKKSGISSVFLHTEGRASVLDILNSNPVSPKKFPDKKK